MDGVSPLSCILGNDHAHEHDYRRVRLHHGSESRFKQPQANSLFRQFSVSGTSGQSIFGLCEFFLLFKHRFKFCLAGHISHHLVGMLDILGFKLQTVDYVKEGVYVSVVGSLLASSVAYQFVGSDRDKSYAPFMFLAAWWLLCIVITVLSGQPIQLSKQVNLVRFDAGSHAVTGPSDSDEDSGPNNFINNLKIEK